MTNTEVHFPPKFDLEGRKQLWFIRTEGSTDELVNGMIAGTLVWLPLVTIAVLPL